MADVEFAGTASSLPTASSLEHQKLPKTGNWGPAEDFRLRQAVSKHGPRWVLVADDVGTRNGDQCAKRWKDKLNPELDHSQWSPDEEERLLDLVGIYGHNWKFIAQNSFQSRAPLSLKNSNSLLMRRIKRQTRGGGRLQQKVSINVLEQAQTTLGQDRNLDSCYGSDMAIPSLTSQTNAANTASLPHGSETTPYSRQQTPARCQRPVSAANDSQTPWGSASLAMTGAVGSAATSGVSPAVISRQEYVNDAMMMRRLSLSEWDDQDLAAWPQEFGPADTAGMADIELTTAEMGGSSDGFDWGEILNTPQGTEDAIIDQPPHRGPLGGGRSPNSPFATSIEQASNRDRHRAASPTAVEYSVTCRRGKVRTFVNHLMDAGNPEIAERAAEDDYVTIKLRIDV